MEFWFTGFRREFPNAGLLSKKKAKQCEAALLDDAAVLK